MARDHRVGHETALVEDFLARVAKGDGLAAYGPDDVARAMAAGAVESLLVSDRVVREGKADVVLAQAEAARSQVHVLSSSHEAGSQLDKMGGLAALLRFRVE